LIVVGTHHMEKKIAEYSTFIQFNQYSILGIIHMHIVFGVVYAKDA